MICKKEGVKDVGEGKVAKKMFLFFPTKNDKGVEKWSNEQLEQTGTPSKKAN